MPHSAGYQNHLFLGSFAAIFFYILFYVSMPFNEERTEFKKLQSISPGVYWLSVFLFDGIVHLAYCYLLYWVHIAIDTYHIFDHMEYGKLQNQAMMIENWNLIMEMFHFIIQ